MLKRWLTLVLFAVMATATVQAQEIKAEDLYKRTLPSVMTLLVEKKNGSTTIGSGFMTIKESLAVTSWHVVEGAKRVVAKFSTGEEFDVSGLIDKDERRDVALIRIKVFGKAALPTATADPAIGSKAFLIGAPKGLEFSFSDGMVSQIQTLEGVKQYQFTCAASPGNSGGPLLNETGEVIGLVSWQVADGQNLNFAVPIVYALGLDASLPTQPWDAVRASEPVPSPVRSVVTSNDVLDLLIAECLIAKNDAELQSVFLDAQISLGRSGYEDGVSSSAYATQIDLKKRLDKLQGATSADPVRQKIRNHVVASTQLISQYLAAQIQAIKKAQADGGYTAETSDQFRQASALLQVDSSTPKPTRDDIEVMGKSKTFVDALPVDLRVELGIINDETGFELGVDTFLRYPSYMALVYKNSVAEKLGFRTNDTVLTVAGTRVECMQDVKMQLKANEGKKIKLRVLRDDKEKEWDTKVPQDLAKMK